MKEKFLQLFIFNLLTLISGFSLSYSQAPDIMWMKNYGESDWDLGNSVLQTADGGFFVAGRIGFIPGQLSTGDVWLIRTDPTGDTLWTKTYGGTSGRDEAYSIQQTNDGGYIIAGETTSFGAGASDAFLIRINANGDTLWTKTYGGISEEYAVSIKQTSDNGFIIVGRTHSYGAGSTDVWLIRTNENGDTLWTKTFGTAGVDYGNSVNQTTDGGFIVIGRKMSFTSGTPDLFLIRTDPDGDTVWTKSYNGPLSPYSLDIGIEAQQLPNGGFLIAGTADARLWLLRTDSNGDTLYTKIYSGGCNAMEPTSDGGFIIAGNNLLIRINDEADTLWTKVQGTVSDITYSVSPTSDGGYIFTGRFNNINNTDVWLFRLESEILTAVEDGINNLQSFQLFQNYPNPFNPSTTIRFTISDFGFTNLKLFDVLGNEVATLVNEFKPAGSYEVEFNAASLPSGIYFYQLSAGNFIETKKLMLMK